MANIQPIPPGFHSVTPHLVCAGAAQAIDFYRSAFGATEVTRMPGPDGKIMHAQLRIGDSVVMLVDEMPSCGALGPRSIKGTPVTIHLYVADADATAAAAVKAGATLRMPVSEQFWGDRYGVLEDPFGHHWAVATRVKELTPAQVRENMQKMMEQQAAAPA